MWRENPGQPTEAPPPALPPAAAEVPTAPRAVRPTDPANAPLGALNGRLVSRTDLDAGLVSRRDKIPPGLYYKIHLDVGGGAARLITAVDVASAEVGDEQLLHRLIGEHAGNTGRPKKCSSPMWEVSATSTSSAGALRLYSSRSPSAQEGAARTVIDGPDDADAGR